MGAAIELATEPPMSSLPVAAYRPETPDDDPFVDALAADAFGPGRFARAAERVRERAAHERALSFVAILDGDVVGAVRQTRIMIGLRPALMLGPLAVRPAQAGKGIGRRLMALAAEAARGAGESLIILVGDLSYYGPLGYEALPTGSVILPGPVDQTRILGLPLAADALRGVSGIVGPRR